MDQKREIIEISTMSIVRALGVVVAFWLIYLVRDVFVILFIVLILTSALSPIVSSLNKKRKVPRIVAILIIYLVIIAVLVLIGYLIIPPVVVQLQGLARDLPNYFDKISSLFGSISRETIKEIIGNFENASKTMGAFASQLLSVSAGFLGGLATLVTILVLTLFLLLEEDGIKTFLVSLLPVREKDFIIDLAKKVSNKIGAWLTGQLILMAIVGVITAVGLLLLKVPYALTLALLAALLEIVPTIGPILAVIPAAFIALVARSPLIMLLVIVFYVLVQQVENQIFVPKVMQKAVGLSPVVIILAILIGAKLAGVLGIVLAVPVAAGFSVLIKEWPSIRARLDQQ